MKLEILSIALSAVGVFVSIVAIIAPTSLWFILAIIAIFLVLTVFSAIQNCRINRNLKSNKLCWELNNYINQNFSKLQKTAEDKEAIMTEFMGICSKIADIIKGGKNNDIRVCIKYINGERDANGKPRNFYVETYCHDSATEKQIKDNKAQGIYTRKLTGTIDYISENTDFESIFNIVDGYNRQRESIDYSRVFYCQNWLPFCHQYKNSHLDPSSVSYSWKIWKRNSQWPLEYKSTIVVPIISFDTAEIFGFLCVDSKKNYGFSSSKDVPIMQNIAISLRELVKITWEKQLN